MAATATLQKPGQFTLDDFPPALRKAVEGCPFDLLPWIDPCEPVPARPLYKDFDRFCDGIEWRPSISGARTLIKQGDFFDPLELTAPALQWCVWSLIRDRYTKHTIALYIQGAAVFTAWLTEHGGLERDPLAGVNFSAWARGELGHIKRLPGVCWESLWLYEKEGAPTYWNLAAVLEARDDLPQGDAGERKRSLNNLSQQIQKARHVRENPPGAPLFQHVGKTRSDEPGSFRAMCELFLLWRAVLQGRGFRYSGVVKSRWNQFPRTVMRAIAGSRVKYLRKYDSYHLLYERIHGGSRSRARSREDATGALTTVEKRSCGGGAKCARNREFARRAKRGESWETIYGWYVALRPSQRADVCPVHTRLPASPREVKKLAIKASGLVQPDWIAHLRADPVAGHDRLLNRKLRSFHNWCYETLHAAGGSRRVSGVVTRYCALCEEEQMALFGQVWPAGKPLPNRRREMSVKIRAAIATVELEFELGRVRRQLEAADHTPADPQGSGGPEGMPDEAATVGRTPTPPEAPWGEEQTEPPAPPEDEPELWHSESFREVRWGEQEYEFTGRQAACIRVLWQAAERQMTMLHQDDILKQAESESSRLRDVFRPGRSRPRKKMHPAWGTLLLPIRGKQGCYGLAPFLS